MARTKVECAGQCLLTPSCTAFRYEGSTCETFNADYLYRNKNDNYPKEVYIDDSLWNMHGNEKQYDCKTSKKRQFIVLSTFHFYL